MRPQRTPREYRRRGWALRKCTCCFETEGLTCVKACIAHWTGARGLSNTIACRLNPSAFGKALNPYDCVYGDRRELWDPSAVLHHVLFAWVTAYVLQHSIMKFPFAWLSLCELSTPLVNTR